MTLPNDTKLILQTLSQISMTLFIHEYTPIKNMYL